MIWGTPMFGNLHMGLDGWGIDYLRIRLPMNAVAVTPRSGVSRAVGVRNAHQRHVGTLIDQPSRFPLFQPISRSRWGRVVYQTRTFSSRNKTLLFWLGSWVIDHDWWRNGQGNAYAMFIAAVFFPCVGTIAHEVAMARCSCMQHLQVGMCESRWWVYLKCFHCTAAINIIIDGYYDYAYIYMIIHIQYKVYMCLNACVFTPIKSPHTHTYIYTHTYTYFCCIVYAAQRLCRTNVAGQGKPWNFMFSVLRTCLKSCSIVQHPSRPKFFCVFKYVVHKSQKDLGGCRFLWDFWSGDQELEWRLRNPGLLTFATGKSSTS
jgi:hypothetical protein